MPKSFLVKKRVLIPTSKETQDLSDAELKHKDGKTLCSCSFKDRFFFFTSNDLFSSKFGRG